MLFSIKACAQLCASPTIAADEKHSQQGSYCIAPGHGSQPGREDIFPSNERSEIMPEARIKPEVKILKFKQVTLCPTWQA